MPQLLRSRPPKAKLSVTTTEPVSTRQKPSEAASVSMAHQSKANDSGRGTATTVNTTSVSRGSSKAYHPVATRKPITPAPGPASKKRKTQEREPDPPSSSPSPSPPIRPPPKTNKNAKSDGEKGNQYVNLSESDASEEELFPNDNAGPSNAIGTGSTIVPSTMDSEATPSLPVPPKPKVSKGRVESSSEDEEVDVDTVNQSQNEDEEPLSPVVGKRPRRPSSRLSNGRSESGRRERSTGASFSASESGLSEYSFNPNDPDWMQFKKSVMENPESAHERLSIQLVESQNCAALLGKLIYRSISDVDEKSSNSKRLCEQYGVTIIKAVLHLTLLHEHNSSIVVDLVNMIFTEIRHFRTGILCTIVMQHCMKYMETDKDREGSLPPRWIEIFGKIASVLMTRGDIKLETDTLDGQEIRDEIMNGISRLEWTSDNTASLIAVIREIPGLQEANLLTIFHKIRTCVQNVKPAAFPPIVHQLILLAGHRCPSELLSVCAKYFENVDFTDFNSMEVRQKRNALGTVLYHLLEAAKHCDALVKAVIRLVKESFFDFGKVMSTFTLSVVLGLTTFGHAKAAIIDPLRNSVMKSFHSMHLSEMSYWYRNKASNSEDKVTACFRAILETKSSDLEFMFDGLRDLAIGLLNADLYQKNYPNTLERSQKLGSYLIVSLVKNCPDQLASMLRHLLKVSSKSSVHAECLATCLEMRTRQIIHPSIIGLTCEIIRHLPMMDSNSAPMIVKSLSSAFQLSYILVDQIMLILRKTIWKSVDARKTAAQIMIILLSNSRVVGDVPYSQYSESQRFYNDSQNQDPSSSSNGSHISDNQPVCMEILTLTTRCFSQQCEIKQELYLGFHSVIRKNPALCELICSQLYNQCTQYFADDNNENPTLSLHKIVSLPQTANSFQSPAVITEQLGFLVQCLSFVVHRSHQVFNKMDDDAPPAVGKLEKLLQRWTTAILKLDVATIEVMASGVVEGAGGSRPLDTVHFVRTLFTIQLMQVTEALIEFLNLENANKCDSVMRKLFKKHGEMEPLLKKEKEKVATKKGKGKKGGGEKGGKDKDKDTSNEDVTVLDDAASETSTNPGGGAGVKFKRPEAPKRLTYFHILGLESALDMLGKLQKSADKDKGSVLAVQKDGPEFEKFLLSVVQQKLDNFKNKESLRERQRPLQKVLETFSSIAGCIWNGLLIHNSEEENGESAFVNEATSQMIELRVEVVNEITALLCQSHPSVCAHLIKEMCDDATEDSYDEMFTKFFNSWRSVHEWIPSSMANANYQHIHEILFDILHSFGKPLSPDSADHLETNKTGGVLSWLWSFMRSGKTGLQPEFLLGESVASCWLLYFMKAKDFLEQPVRSQHDVITLALAVKKLLGIQDEIVTQQIQDVKLWIVSEDSAPRVLCAIMNHIETILGHVSATLAKIKSHNPEDDDSKQRAADLSAACYAMLNEIVETCSELVITNFPSGLCCTTMLKIVPQIFTVITGFGEYINDFKQYLELRDLKRFARPVSNIGKKFKPHVEAMIAYIERVQREYADDLVSRVPVSKRSKQQKIPQAVKNQFLKEKRLIPNMVYSIEKYDHQIIMIAKKNEEIKSFLLVGMKLSECHVFRVDGKKIVQVIKDNERNRSQAVDRSTIPDEETNLEATGAAVPGPSKRSGVARARKAKKRKTPEAEDDEASNDAE